MRCIRPALARLRRVWQPAGERLSRNVGQFNDRSGILPLRHARLAGGELPARDARTHPLRRRHVLGRPKLDVPIDAQRLWLERMVQRGWTTPPGRRTMAAAGSPAEARVLDEEMARIGAASRSTASAFRCSARAAGVWQRGTEEALPARSPAAKSAGARAIPSRAQVPISQRSDQGRRQGRPLAGQRPENVDELCRQGGLVLLPRTDRRPSKHQGSASC